MTYLWKPPKEVIEEANVTKYMEEKKFENYRQLVKFSHDNIRKFWSDIVDYLEIEFFENYKEVLDISDGIEWAKWFVGGKVNVEYNALEKHKTDKLAFIWFGEKGEIREYSYSQLKDHVSRLANYFKENGVKKGDVIACYMPMLPETVVTLFASLKIGAVFAPIFSGFSPNAVAQRLQDASPKFLVTCDGYYRRGNLIELKKNAEKAIELSEKAIKCLIVRRIGENTELSPGQVFFDEAMKSNKLVECEETEAEDPALLLYTSGTTGKPKGAVITHIGSIIQPTKEIFFNMDLKEDGKLL
ncbi:MAG TPA: AMP-binding protein, partial [Geobacterales bacterium]|nr:AMP-binding protein [Geobacterales bacterium]